MFKTPQNYFDSKGKENTMKMKKSDIIIKQFAKSSALK